jgi:hypothetical protein
MRFFSTLSVCAVLFILAVTSQQAASRSAPEPMRYYIMAKASLWNEKSLRIYGASNLPPGSVVEIYISDFLGQGSSILNDEVFATVGADGLFHAEAHAKQNKTFHLSQLCQISFAPNDPRQPRSVVEVVGRLGEHLGRADDNPQIDGNSRVTTLEMTTVVGS